MTAVATGKPAPGAGCARPRVQPYLHPADLFERSAGGEERERTWTCVRTRPRWEKRLARWLQGHDMCHFLPVAEKHARSCRKVRISELPLFPGFVFVEGVHTKKAFSRSGAVAYVLRPASPHDAVDLDDKLCDVWRALVSGEDVRTVRELSPGEEVEVLAGPMMGARGRYVRKGRQGSIVIWIDMLGTGVSVEIDDATLVEPVT